MPKLNADAAAKVEEAEGGNFEPLPEGTYLAVLSGEVTADEGQESGKPYWKWTFKVAEGEEYAGRMLWLNTSLGEDALWKLKEVFQAFGVPFDTHTDDLVGQQVRLVVVQKIQKKGARAGELQNEIKNLLPVHEDGESAEDATPARPAAKKAAAKKSKAADDVMF